MAPYTLPLFKKNESLHRSSFQKCQHFSTFLHIFRVDEMCNISNKYRSARNLLTNYFYTRDFITLLYYFIKFITFFPCFPKAIGALCHGFLEASTFYHMFTGFDSR